MDQLVVPSVGALDRPSLLSMAHTFEALALQYRARAAELEEWERIRNAPRVPHVMYAEIPEAIIAAMSTGLSEEEAISSVVISSAYPFKAVRGCWKAFQRKKKIDDNSRRSVEVLLLARKHSNSEIGELLGLHPGSVSRILRKALVQHQSAGAK